MELPLDLVVAGITDGAEGVQVLDLGDGSLVFFSILPHPQVDVGIAAHVALLQVALGNTHVAQDFLHRLHEQGGLLRGGDVWLGDNLDEGGAAAVVVDVAVAALQMEALAHVLLQMDALHPHPTVLSVDVAVVPHKVQRTVFFPAGLLLLGQMLEGQVYVAVGTEGNVVLGNLVALSQVGIEIVLAVKFGKASDVAVQGKPCHSPQLHIALADTGHGSRQAEADGTDTGVRHTAIPILTGTKGLGLCQKLAVNLTSNDNLVFFYAHITTPLFQGKIYQQLKSIGSKARAP